MATISESLDRFRVHRRGWDFEFRTDSGSLWWSHVSLEDTCEYFGRLINTSLGHSCDYADLSEFSVETVAIMLSYLDKFTEPVSIVDCREFIEECLVASDRYGVADLKTAIISELGSDSDDAEYTRLAEKYGIELTPPYTYSLHPTLYQPSGSLNISYARHADYIGESLFKTIRFTVDEPTHPREQRLTYEYSPI